MGRITEVAVLEINEAQKFENFAEFLGGIPETEKERMRTKGKKLKKKNGKQWGGASK